MSELRTASAARARRGPSSTSLTQWAARRCRLSGVAYSGSTSLSSSSPSGSSSAAPAADTQPSTCSGGSPAAPAAVPLRPAAALRASAASAAPLSSRHVGGRVCSSQKSGKGGGRKGLRGGRSDGVLAVGSCVWVCGSCVPRGAVGGWGSGDGLHTIDWGCNCPLLRSRGLPRFHDRRRCCCGGGCTGSLLSCTHNPGLLPASSVLKPRLQEQCRPTATGHAHLMGCLLLAQPGRCAPACNMGEAREASGSWLPCNHRRCSISGGHATLQSRCEQVGTHAINAARGRLHKSRQPPCLAEHAFLHDHLGSICWLSKLQVSQLVIHRIHWDCLLLLVKNR